MKSLDHIKAGSRLFVYNRGEMRKMRIKELNREKGWIEFEEGVRVEGLGFNKGVATLVAGGKSMLGKQIVSVSSAGLIDILWLWCKQDLLTMTGDTKLGERKIRKLSERMSKLLVKEMTKLDLTGADDAEEDEE